MPWSRSPRCQHHRGYGAAHDQSITARHDAAVLTTVVIALNNAGQRQLAERNVHKQRNRITVGT